MNVKNRLTMGYSFINQGAELNGLVRLLIELSLEDETYLNKTVIWTITHNDKQLFTKEYLLTSMVNSVNTAFHSQYFQGENVSFEVLIESTEGEVLCFKTIEFKSEDQGVVGAEVKKQIESGELSLFLDGKIDSTMFPYHSISQKPWFEQKDGLVALEKKLKAGLLTEELGDKFKMFFEDGYMIFENLIEPELIEKLNTDLDLSVSEGYQGYSYGSSQRIEFLHRKYDSFHKLFLNDKYLNILDNLFGTKALPCQTLTYLFGSQQDAHQDTVHLTPFPSGYMVGVWIALQDIEEDSGELVVFPGSHRLKRIYMDDVGCEKVSGDWGQFSEKVVKKWAEMAELGGFDRKRYLPKKGDVLIWHENLLHEGSGRKNLDLERRSLVIHAFAKGTSIYYDSTGEVGFAVNER